MSDTLTVLAKKVFEHPLVVGTIAGAAGTVLAAVIIYLVGVPSVTLPMWVFVIIAAFAVWGIIDLLKRVYSLRREERLTEEQLKIIDFLYIQNKRGTLEELENAAKINHRQDAIFFIGNLCDETKHLQRLKGKPGLTTRNSFTGMISTQKAIPTYYVLTNKGRELAMRRNRKEIE